MSSALVLALGEELYGRTPAGFLLAIRGSEWDRAEGISAEAERILSNFLKNG